MIADLEIDLAKTDALSTLPHYALILEHDWCPVKLGLTTAEDEEHAYMQCVDPGKPYTEGGTVIFRCRRIEKPRDYTREIINNLVEICVICGYKYKRRNRMETQRILVTGGAGFIGTTLVYELRKRGHEIIALDQSNTEREEYVRADVRNYRQLEKVFDK